MRTVIRNSILQKPKTSLNYVSDGDASGLFYYLGTNNNTTAWSNPYTAGKITIAASAVGVQPVSGLVDRATSDFYGEITVVPVWLNFGLNFSKKIKPNYYSLRSRISSGDYLRTWKLQGSRNGSTWTDLDSQVNRTTLNSPNQWLSLPCYSPNYYSTIRLIQLGVNSSGRDYLCLGELELYGTVF